jgi:hypothetical protein
MVLLFALALYVFMAVGDVLGWWDGKVRFQ